MKITIPQQCLFFSLHLHLLLPFIIIITVDFLPPLFFRYYFPYFQHLNLFNQYLFLFLLFLILLIFFFLTLTLTLILFIFIFLFLFLTLPLFTFFPMLHNQYINLLEARNLIKYQLTFLHAFLECILIQEFIIKLKPYLFLI